MSSGLPDSPREGRIIPFPAPAAPAPDAADASPPTPPADFVRLRELRTEAARHYLKFMLPSIPIATSLLSFIYWYLMLGIGLRAEHGGPPAAAGAALVDPTLPLVGAVLLALVTGGLCMAIYFGFLRICALRHPGG